MKIRFIIISFIALILAGWGYSVYKFEKQAKKDIVAILDELEGYITYDSMKINKYGFSVTLNKVMLEPLDFYSDEIVIKHIPFLNITKIDSYGNDVKISTAEDEENILYSPDHHITIWFKESLLNRLPNYWKLSLSENSSTIYSSWNAEKLAEFNNQNVIITNTKTSDSLNLFGLDIKSNVSFISENYIKSFTDRILEFLEDKVGDTGIFEHDLGKLDILNSPISYNYKLKLKYSDELKALGKLLIQSFPANQEPDESLSNAIFMQIVNEVLRGKPCLFAIDLEYKGKIESNIFRINIEKDKIFDFVFNIKFTEEPSEIYRKIGEEVFGSYFSNGLNKRAELDTNFRLIEPITIEDGKKAIGFLRGINNIEFNLKGEFDPEENKLYGSTNFIIDNFNFAADINMPNLDNPMNLEGQIALSNPKIFINNFVDYTNNAVVPVLNKIEEAREFALTLKKQALVINQYGFGTIEAFSKNSQLKDGESLVVNVKGTDGEITFNDKAIDQVFNDPRVTEFINAIAAIDQEVAD